MPKALQFPKADTVDLGGGRHVRLLRPLGKGSASTVYKALLFSELGVRRQVALKVFGALATDDFDVVVPVLARVAARGAAVRHPNVVGIEEFGLWHSQPFTLGELVDGVTLAQLTERNAEKSARLPLDLALFIATEVAEGLSGARTARDADGVQLGMLHLGLSSREILLSWRGEVKVSDFELSIARGATSSVRSLRSLASRASMVAPEIARGHVGDARSDVFALGVLARELLVGPRFPKGLSSAETLRLSREGYVEPLTFQPNLPDALVAVVQRALDLDPASRYPNASAMVSELRRVSMSMGVGDGRWFLRRTLDREWGNDAAETTREHAFQVPSPPAEDERAQVVTLRGPRRVECAEVLAVDDLDDAVELLSDDDDDDDDA
jgi:eukaryotic-like serine/threonine-protein kinase